MVENFGVNYVVKENAHHFVRVLKENYEISEDWNGNKYVGLTFDCDYTKRQVHVSMPGYVNTALFRFNHITPRKPQDQPYKHVIPKYGTKNQYAEITDSVACLIKRGKIVHKVTGTFLNYAISVDSIMLVSLSAFSYEQASPTQKTMEKVTRLLNYAASQEEAVITYHASDMVLACHSGASYLRKPGARSREGGHFSDQKMPPCQKIMGRY